MKQLPNRISEEMLHMSSPQGMSRTAASLGPNAYDSGGASKLVNTQPYNNERLAQQNILQNTISGAQQAQSNAVMDVRKNQLVADNQDAKANEFAATRMAELLYANDQGTALMKVNALMRSPEGEKFRMDIATGKAMAMGVNPDLVG